MTRIPFTVSARTAKLIGQENFANAEGAIVELVKNTYDADSRNCIVIFENHKELANNPSIYIIDNGIGMTDEVIKKNWMTIGTDDKLQNLESDLGRIKTGAKGIGRFALNRLGVLSEMITISKEKESAFRWNVDWRGFDKIGAVITEVTADLNEIPFISVEEIIRSKFQMIPNLNEILSSNTFKYGTIIKISQLNDEWDSETIKSLFDNLEILIPPQEQPSFNIDVFSTVTPDAFGKVNRIYYDDYDYKISAHYLGDDKHTIEVEITRNELDLNSLEKEFSDVFNFDQMNKFPFRLEDLKQEKIKILTSLHKFKGFSNIIDVNLINKIGEFDFTFYYIKNTVSDDNDPIKRYPYKDFVSSSRKAWLKKFGGVKIFRDEFRVRPYGENGEDWLRLGERQAQSPGGAGQKLGGFRIRPNQISGTINISRIKNPYFQDKSGREGIQENDVFEVFKNVIIEIISIFERDRNIIMFNLSELWKKRNIEEKAKADARRIAKELNKKRVEKEDKADSLKKENILFPNEIKYTLTPEETLAKGFTALEQELEEKDNELSMLRNLASTGLIISSFAHELKSLRSRLIPRTKFLDDELNKYIRPEQLANIDIEDNPYYMIDLIRQEDLKLKHWIDYSLNSLKKDKRKRNKLDFNDYFKRFKSTWEKAVQQRNVKIILESKIDSDYNFKALEVDMDSIFNNLLANSINSLLDKQSDNKYIKITWGLIDNYIEIIFFDNGRGLSEEYKENPEIIFNSFESSTTDKKGNPIGTGLGLYIVKLTVNEYKGSTVNVFQTENCFSLKILFKTNKNEY